VLASISTQCTRFDLGTREQRADSVERLLRCRAPYIVRVMDFSTQPSFNLGTLLWTPRAGEWNLSVIVKATFTLAPGASNVSAPQQDTVHDDVSWDQHTPTSLYAPSDYVPPKPRADVLLVGRACAPGGAAVESLIARLQIGHFSKSVRVIGDRVWMSTPEGPRPSRPRPFTELPLRYERAARCGDNLGGIPIGPGIAVAGQPLPNIEPFDEQSTRATPGFGALPPGWRMMRSPSPQEAWAFVSRLRTSPVPPPQNLDWGVLNAAPRDQQIDQILPGSTLVLENIHPRHARFETRLPEVRPNVTRVDARTGASSDVAMRCDTLWIDADREILVMTWRGSTVGAPGETSANQFRVSWVKDAKPAASRIAFAKNTVDYSEPATTTPALPFAPEATDSPKVAPAPRSRIAFATGTRDVTDSLKQPVALPFAAAEQEPPAREIPIEVCAEIAAIMTHRKDRQAETLKKHDLSAEQWNAERERWDKAIDDEIAAGKTALLKTYDAAYIGALERERGEIKLDEYARLAVSSERGTKKQVLEALDLPAESVMRLERVYIAKIVNDASFGVRVRAAIAAARKA
jgi:hypothetical protein